MEISKARDPPDAWAFTQDDGQGVPRPDAAEVSAHRGFPEDQRTIETLTGRRTAAGPVNQEIGETLFF